MRSQIEQHFNQAKRNDRTAQKALFEMFSGKMLSIAKSYVGNYNDAEDVLMNAFYKAFTKIEDCKEWKSFPFWLRKIVVNDSITFIRKNKNILYANSDGIENLADENDEDDFLEELNLEEIFSEIPLGYKLVFNLYVFEEKKHSEIAEILNISEGTSKSQLNKAKKWLVEYLKKSKNVQQNVE